MFWLEAKSRHCIRKDEPSDWIIRWRVDVHAMVDLDHYPSGPDSFVVGRLMADEIRRYDVEEQGETIYEVGDSDSGGLLDALTCLFPPDGVGGPEFSGIAEPVVLLHRFELHPEFNGAKLAVLDSFCHIYGSEAVIAFGYYANWTLPELHRVGFEEFVPRSFDGGPRGKFMVRDNTIYTEYGPANYPTQYPSGSEHHTRWLEQHGPWHE